MKLNVEKHARKFMWALDRGAKTDLPKTEDEYIALAASILRPIIRKVLDESVERGSSAEEELFALPEREDPRIDPDTAHEEIEREGDFEDYAHLIIQEDKNG